VAKNKTRRKTKKLNQQHLTLNAAIGIVGVLLLGFIYSFSQNASYTGVPIKVKFPENNSPQKLAADFYDDNRLHDVKVEVLNGCGIKGVAGKTAEFLRLQHQLNVVRSDNADNHNYAKTIIINRREKVEAMKLICKSFGVPIESIKHEPDESLDVDATIIIGKDINTFSEVFAYISSVN